MGTGPDRTRTAWLRPPPAGTKLEGEHAVRARDAIGRLARVVEENADLRMALARREATAWAELKGRRDRIEHVAAMLAREDKAPRPTRLVDIHTAISRQDRPGRYRRLTVVADGWVPPHPAAIANLVAEMETWLEEESDRLLAGVWAERQIRTIEPFEEYNSAVARCVIIMLTGAPLAISRELTLRTYDYQRLSADGNWAQWSEFMCDRIANAARL